MYLADLAIVNHATWGMTVIVTLQNKEKILASITLFIFLQLYLNYKILDWLKLKSFADNKINVTKKLKSVLGRVKNFVGKGENAGYQYFLLSQNVCKSILLQGRSKLWLIQ